MKFKIDVEITPEEVRRLMGLPDVQAFHEEILAQIRSQMAAGADGYDPKTLMRPFVNQATASMEMFQRLFGGMLGAGITKDRHDD
ncbi:hypothetical protein TI04_08440 [Achromatium sp. WMS2]|nr:hypothetical protein TI04_08440 [Achromatium sp. WMS2]